MANLDRKVNLLIKMLLAEEPEEAANARDQLEDIVKNGGRNPVSAEEHIRDIIMEIGVPDHLIGHSMLVQAALICYNTPFQTAESKRALFPRVAEIHNTTLSNVDGAMSRAIDSAFNRGDTDTLLKWFGNTISAARGKPTTFEFVTRVANAAKMRMKHEGA